MERRNTRKKIHLLENSCSIEVVIVFRFVVLAGDVTPIDVYSHLPVMCEDRNIPYCYVPSKVVSES